MSAQLLSSKIVILEEEPRIRSVPALATAVVGCVGVTERGPFGPTVVTSFEEYVKRFGGFTTDSDVAIAAFGFFLNGGETMWIGRTCHHTDVTSQATRTAAKGTLTLQTLGGAASNGQVLSSAGPFKLVDGDTLVVNSDEGSPQGTATVNGTAASVTSGNSETYALSDGQILTVEIDDGSEQTVTFNTADFADIANATAEEVAAVINQDLSGAKAFGTTDVTIESDVKGLGSKVEITGGTANIALGFSTSPVIGTGNVNDLDNVTATEITGLLSAISGVTATVDGSQRVLLERDMEGLAYWVQIDATSTADDELGFDNDVHTGSDSAPQNTTQIDGKTEGAYTDTLSIQIGDATSGEAAEFNLSVVDDGVIVEVFPNLDADTVAGLSINDPDTGSDLIAASDLAATGSLLQRRPVNGTFGPMSGGDDGLIDLDDNDFIGNVAGPTGMYELDQVQTLTLLIVPGQATSAIHNAMVQYCEVHREGSMFAVLDPPASMTATEMVNYVVSTAALLELSEYAAIYWPRVKILNPNKNVFGNTDDITVAPSGFIVGVYARTDAASPGGIYQSPAGIERGIMFGVIGFETNETEDERKRDLVYPKNINPITVFPGTPRHIDGGRCLKTSGNFPSVPERRGVIFIEQSLKIGLLFAKHSNNTAELRARCRRTTNAFLRVQMNNGAFATTDPDTAYFVDFSEALNPPSVVFAKQLRGRIGLATAKPTEYVILSFSQDTRALEEELAG